MARGVTIDRREEIEREKKSEKLFFLPLSFCRLFLFLELSSPILFSYFICSVDFVQSADPNFRVKESGRKKKETKERKRKKKNIREIKVLG